eukprot:scaffold1127_cov361-Prasinococcus_capsulatus_cf.AAC.14
MRRSSRWRAGPPRVGKSEDASPTAAAMTAVSSGRPPHPRAWAAACPQRILLAGFLAQHGRAGPVDTRRGDSAGPCRRRRDRRALRACTPLTRAGERCGRSDGAGRSCARARPGSPRPS